MPYIAPALMIEGEILKVFVTWSVERQIYLLSSFAPQDVDGFLKDTLVWLNNGLDHQQTDFVSECCHNFRLTDPPGFSLFSIAIKKLITLH